MDIFDNKKFKKAFWEWFDSLSPEERKRFQEYPADMAELNFYNRVWKNQLVVNATMAERSCSGLQNR